MNDTVLAILTGCTAVLLVGISAWVRGRNDEREAHLLAQQGDDGGRHPSVEPSLEQARPSIPG